MTVGAACLHFLYVLQLLPAPAVGVQRYAGVSQELTSTRNQGPVISGTVLMKDSEVRGDEPLFVDAFFSPEGSSAYLIFNLQKGWPKQSWLAQGWNQTWTCSWFHGSQRDDENARSSKFARAGDVLGHSSLDDFVDLLNELPKNGTKRNGPVDDDTFGSSEAAASWHHATMIVTCPTIKSSTSRPNTITLQSSGIAYHHEHHKGYYPSVPPYVRSFIPVRSESFVKQNITSALCTMVQQQEGVGSLVKPWAQYHANLGIQQLLIYVEENNTDWVTSQVQDLIQQGRVTVVPFYFGVVSERRLFAMQNAMENHCLYEAKGRVSWLGHNDVDEYFDVSKAALHHHHHQHHHHHSQAGLAEILSTFPADSSYVSVSSQFWCESPAESTRATFPCNLNCKGPGYVEGSRPKTFLKPETIRFMFPHSCIQHKGYTVANASPQMLRLNHFKRCLPGVGCHVKNGADLFLKDGDMLNRIWSSCVEDEAWASRCQTLLR